MASIEIELSPEIDARLERIEALLLTLTPQATNEKEVYTTKEAADLLKVSADTIRRMVKEGRLKATRPGGKNMRFKRADLI